jgi:hypothetical protein
MRRGIYFAPFVISVAAIAGSRIKVQTSSCAGMSQTGTLPGLS